MSGSGRLRGHSRQLTDPERMLRVLGAEEAQQPVQSDLNPHHKPLSPVHCHLSSMLLASPATWELVQPSTHRDSPPEHLPQVSLGDHPLWEAPAG